MKTSALGHLKADRFPFTVNMQIKEQRAWFKADQMLERTACKYSCDSKSTFFSQPYP